MATFKVVFSQKKANSPTTTQHANRKEDSTPIVYGTIPEPSSNSAPRSKGTHTTGQQRKLTDIIATSLQSGCSPLELSKQYPGFYLLNKQKVDNYAFWWRNTTRNQSYRVWPSNLSYQGADFSTQQLVEWCRLNIKCKRDFKQKQLFLSGPPNSLKTTFLNILKEYCSSFVIPTGEDYYDLYGDPEPELCYIDEFKGQKTIQWLNEFLQGGDMHLRRR